MSCTRHLIVQRWRWLNNKKINNFYSVLVVNFSVYILFLFYYFFPIIPIIVIVNGIKLSLLFCIAFYIFVLSGDTDFKFRG